MDLRDDYRDVEFDDGTVESIAATFPDENSLGIPLAGDEQAGEIRQRWYVIAHEAGVEEVDELRALVLQGYRKHLVEIHRGHIESKLDDFAKMLKTA